MQVVEYQAAIREAARIAAQYCVLHTVSVFFDYRTTFPRKYVYGSAAVKIIFGKEELMSFVSQLRTAARTGMGAHCIRYVRGDRPLFDDGDLSLLA
jgi:hypothetical protein